MKNLILIFSFAFSAGAFGAQQSISCYQVTKQGRKMEGGGVLNAQLQLVLHATNKRTEGKGPVSIKGFWKKGSEFGKNLSAASGYNNVPTSKVKYAHVNFYDSEGEINYQLQFEKDVLGKNFSNEKADFVIEVDSWNTDPSSGTAHSLICSGKIR